MPEPTDGATARPTPEVPASLLRALSINTSSTTPPYEQVRLGLLGLIQEEKLLPGTRLPPVRTLAGALGVAVNTVARAYKELEQSGAVTARPRLGTVVAESSEGSRAELTEAAGVYAARARQLGYTRAQAVRQLEAVFDS